MISTSSNPILSVSYSRDKLIKVNFFFSFLANLSLWFFLIWQSKNFASLISLHYNIYFGIDLLGPWYKIFILPVLGLGFLLINFSIGLIVYRQEKLLSYFLASGSSFIQIVLIISSVFIILINY